MGMMRAIGLMSGTSMDGIDVAMVETDGIRVDRRGPCLSVPYAADFRRRIEVGLADAQAIGTREERPGTLAELERGLTMHHADAVKTFLDEYGIAQDSVDVIGFHGQTVLHRPEKGLTLQIGDGSLLARYTGIPVVSDMRANDMKHGGQGAPLVPVYHAALAMNLPPALEPGFGPVAFVNIGGISNVTFIACGQPPMAFDCGPGNMLIDQWMEQQAGVPFDDGGRIAGEGNADMAVVKRYLSAPFFAKDGPKSLDRGDFTLDGVAGMELSDGAATLAMLTAAAIVKSAERLEVPPALWIVSGGGVRNRAIMASLRAVAGRGVVIATAGEAGFNADMMEAEAWAYLAVRSMKGLPLTFPTTTGCDRPVTGGVSCRPI
ncbi:anhydro-N-acetylmuramic acid kinase [Oricola thermophila]|uniref:Anhydro-N-acetylmuramic acid kinase n=1 Tax=Oricola thermophila TaxID=2742145 RepID=A0A6N1VID6_9HYPH|nr:anhydro-N-acetylmuramic acid kinase [Oricola thermophila]QKV20534.1 anhydro-N-acetylmuramic acid kinase [Oricola thermophila]